MLMPVSKLNLYNFSAVSTARIYETFFYNVCIAEKTFFYFCPCFHKSFRGEKIIRKPVIFEKYPSDERICCCCECETEIFSKISIRKKLRNDFFDELKKMLIQYFYNL